MSVPTDTDYDSDYDTVSDCDADADIESLYGIVTNIISHVSEKEALGSEYRKLIDAYHERYKTCRCINFLPEEADAYHLKLVIAVLESYYGPDYQFIFVANLPALGEEPSDTQMSAMFTDERVPYQVQYRLLQEGIVDQLPRLESIASDKSDSALHTAE